MWCAKMKNNFKRVIVITGGTSGIGKYLMSAFSNDEVICLARSVVEDEHNIKVDVSDFLDVQRAFEIIKDRYGRVDILVNNAGYAVNGATELLTDEEVEKQMNVNFLGVFRCIKYALPLMQDGGKIVNISSACAIFPLPFRGIYCASKSAVSMLSHSLREELRPYNISVTAVCPGDVKTDFSKNRVKVVRTSERYGTRIERAFNDIDERENKRMSVEYAGKVIAKIIAKKKYKPFYIVGKKYKFLYALYKIFPLSTILSFTGKMFAKEKKKGRKEKVE